LNSIIEGYLEWSFMSNAIGTKEENAMQVPGNSSVTIEYYEAFSNELSQRTRISLMIFLV
jgi:hypothetical protein